LIGTAQPLPGWLGEKRTGNAREQWEDNKYIPIAWFEAHVRENKVIVLARFILIL
jgi:hypothetical protein